MSKKIIYVCIHASPCTGRSFADWIFCVGCMCLIFHSINGVHTASTVVITHLDMKNIYTYTHITHAHKDWPLNFTLFCVFVSVYFQFRNNYVFREEDFWFTFISFAEMNFLVCCFNWSEFHSRRHNSLTQSLTENEREREDLDTHKRRYIL